MQGVADGAGLPFEQILILNTYVDTMMALRSITFFIRGMQAPRLVQVSVEGGLMRDGVDNDGDGEVDEAGEGADESWNPGPYASLVEVPVDASIRMVLEDTDALAEFAGEDVSNGEGVNPESIRVQYNDALLEHDDPQLRYETSVDEDGIERLAVILTPDEGFEPASVCSLILQAGDLSWVLEPAPAHARYMRDERIVFTTEGYGKAPQEVENRGELDGRTQPTSIGFALRGSATPDGQPRLGYHFTMLDVNSAHKHTMVAYHHPDEGDSFVTIGWTGIIWGLTGINSRGLSYGTNSSDTLDNGMVVDVLANASHLENASLVVSGTPIGFVGREILSRCGTVDEAVELLRTTRRTFGWNMILADAEGDIASIEMDSDILGMGTGFRQIQITDEGPMRTASAGPDDLLMGSHYVSNVDDFSISVMRPQRFWSSFYFRSVRAFYILGEEISAHYGELDTPTVIDVLRVPGIVDYRDSMMAVVYEPSSRVFHVALGRVPATDAEFRRFSMSDFENGGAR
jgi:hypothetical protein